MLAINPTQVEAVQGLGLVGERLVQDFAGSLGQDELSRAGHLLALAETIPDLSDDMAGMRQQLETRKATLSAVHAEQQRIAEFLDRAQQDLVEGRFVGAGVDNALAKFRAVQILEPGNAAANTGIARIAERLSEQTRAAIDEHDFARATLTLAQLTPLHPDGDFVAELGATLAAASQQHEQEQTRARALEDLLAQADSDLAASRLTTPAGRNAREHYDDALKIDPGNKRAKKGLSNVGRKIVGQVNEAVADGAIRRAEELLETARGLVPSSAGFKAAEENLIDLRVAHEREQAERLVREQQVRIEAQQRQQATAEAERRRLQEQEAFRILAEQNRRAKQQKHAAAQQMADVRRRIVLRFDGFAPKYRPYGVYDEDIRADLEQRLGNGGYEVLSKEQSLMTRDAMVLLVRFRTHLLCRVPEPA